MSETSEFSDRLEEYVDGLLSEEECLAIERALSRDAGLREELGRVRRFATLLEGVRGEAREERAIARIMAAARRPERVASRRRLVAAAALLAAAAFLLGRAGRTLPSLPSDPTSEVARAAAGEWVVFGKRLGAIAAERRAGGVPRTGLAGLETPPAKAAGVVFSAALGVLGVPVEPAREERLHEMIVSHFETLLARPEGIERECALAESALELYRRLRLLAGREVADAFYDLFRPGLGDPLTARRILDPAELPSRAGAAYVQSYDQTVARLVRRYGPQKVAWVLGSLAPTDPRDFLRDATERGIGRDAVLVMKADLYRAALDAGAERLFVSQR
ncbi:MAG: hypothetical protein ACT4PV_07970 [Planctomycetaceae bacterium]